ncbi:unnamed protein product, partial [Musa textilis]
RERERDSVGAKHGNRKLILLDSHAGSLLCKFEFYVYVCDNCTIIKPMYDPTHTNRAKGVSGPCMDRARSK